MGSEEGAEAVVLLFGAWNAVGVLRDESRTVGGDTGSAAVLDGEGFRRQARR